MSRAMPFAQERPQCGCLLPVMSSEGIFNRITPPAGVTMTLVINGNASQRQLVLQMLNQMCSHVALDGITVRHTPLPSPPPPGPVHAEGCDGLRALIESHRRVVIQAVPGPDKPIPINRPNARKISTFGGGATSGDVNAGMIRPDGSPGRGIDGAVGCDATVYIDVTNNKDRGYDQDGLQTQPWLTLAHELTEGHALQFTKGVETSDRVRSEAAAIASENQFRPARALPLRAFPASGSEVDREGCIAP